MHFRPYVQHAVLQVRHKRHQRQSRQCRTPSYLLRCTLWNFRDKYCEKNILRPPPFWHSSLFQTARQINLRHIFSDHSTCSVEAKPLSFQKFRQSVSLWFGLLRYPLGLSQPLFFPEKCSFSSLKVETFLKSLFLANILTPSVFQCSVQKVDIAKFLVFLHEELSCTVSNVLGIQSCPTQKCSYAGVHGMNAGIIG